MSAYVFSVTSTNDFETTVPLVIEALKAEGFGVLTTIDVAATLKAKLELDTPPYLILGACNPSFSHQALMADPDIGALLPCNVVVRVEPDHGVRVVFMDPVAVLGLVANETVTKLGLALRQKLERVVEALRG